MLYLALGCACWARFLSSIDRLALFDERLHAFSAIRRRLHFAGAIQLERQSFLERQLLRRENRGFSFGDRDRPTRRNAICQLTRGLHQLRWRNDAIQQSHTRGFLRTDQIAGGYEFRRNAPSRPQS